MLLTCTLYYDARPGYLIGPIRTVCNYRKCSFLTGLITSLTDLLQANHQGWVGTTKTKSTGSPVLRLQNSRFWTFSEGAKRRKRDPRVWSARALHSLQTSRSNIDRRLHSQKIRLFCSLPCPRPDRFALRILLFRARQIFFSVLTGSLFAGLWDEKVSLLWSLQFFFFLKRYQFVLFWKP